MPDLLPMRELPTGGLVFQCPVCSQWRPGFVFTEPTTEQAEELDLEPEIAFICDNERSRIDRAAVAAAELAIAESLETVRAVQREIINTARDAAINAGAETPVGPVDTDQSSRLLISGAVQTALIAAQQQQPFAIVWTLADDSPAELDVDDMIAMGLAVAAHVDAVHQRSRVLKARIDEAETVEEVRAIVWTMADPE